MTRRSGPDPRRSRRSSLRLLWLWAPVLAYVIAIFLVSAMPQPPGLPGAVGDKWLHAVAYAILGALLVRALSGARWDGVTGKVALASVLLATAYGLTDELHQAYVPGRFADARDLLADAAGATAAAVACLAAARTRAWRPRR